MIYLRHALLLLLLAPRLAFASTELLDQWLEQQAELSNWTAEVTQTREIKNLNRALSTEGQLWYYDHETFRWQLGDPIRTLAIRNGSQLTVLYPQLKEAEQYSFDQVDSAKLRQMLLLMESGFPQDKAAFHQQYQLLETQQTEQGVRFLLQPRDAEARTLLSQLQLDISPDLQHLVRTEMRFPDGTKMLNEFRNHAVNQDLPDDLLEVKLDGYQVSEPLKNQ